MMRPLRVVGAALIAALALLWLVVSPAMADELKSVQLVAQDGRSLSFLVYLDPNATPPTSSSDVTSSVIVSGVEIPSEAAPVVEATGPKEAILVLDVSGSMRGPRLAAAKQAAVNYVNGLPADVEVGLVSFNDKVSLDVPPTANREAVISAINGLKAGQKTALYDGIIGGLDVADPEKGARLLVLSDGGDTVSAATADDVIKRATSEGVPVDIVALTPSTQHAALLRSISTPTGGQFILATDVAGLNNACEEATGSFGGKIAVNATLPDNVDGNGRFAVLSLDVAGTQYKGTTQLPSDPELAATQTSGAVTPPVTDGTNVPVAAPEASSSIWTWVYAILAALIVVVAALAFASYRRQQRARLRAEQVLWYSTAVQTGQVGVRPDMGQGAFLSGVDEWLSEKSWYPRIDTKLDNAGLRMSVATWLLVRIAAALVPALLLSLLLGNALLGLVAGGVVGWLVAGAWLNSKEDARRKAFNDELPDFLLLMASSLRSGLSFQQALDSTAAEGTGEVSRQMRRALREVQMGSTIEAALTRVADRMKSEDLRWTVTALAIQREVGGNLSNILETAANTVKSRAELRREVRTLSAEGRLSGWVLAGLPIGLFLYMMFANRDYISFFWTYTIGWFALGGIAILFVIGFIWMRRLVKIEV